MKKQILILVPILLLLFGCNFPVGQQSNSNVNNQLDEPDQAVTMTYTLEQPAEINTPFLSETPDIQNSPTMTLTDTITETATLTLTQTATNTQEAIVQGDPTWINPLDNGNAFGLDATGYKDDYTSMSVSNGGLVMSSSSAAGYTGWRLTSRNPKNLYLEGTFKIESCGGMDTYGLIVRAPNFDSGYGYYFGVDCNGQYVFVSWNDLGWVERIGRTSDSSIHTMVGETNKLGFWISNNIVKLYVNEKLLKEFPDTTIDESGYIGVYLSGYSSTPLTVVLDEIKYWELP